MQITAQLHFFQRPVCHGITVGLSADISTASATLLAFLVNLFYHIFLFDCDGSVNPVERIYDILCILCQPGLIQNKKILQVALQDFGCM